MREMDFNMTELEVLDFINRRFKIEDRWLNGNCYHFARILQDRFGGSIYYLPIVGHFVTKIDGDYYDWTGKLNDEMLADDSPTAWDYIRYADPILYQRLVRDCVN
jgi:hypothetical protein